MIAGHVEVCGDCPFLRYAVLHDIQIGTMYKANECLAGNAYKTNKQKRVALPNTS